MINPLPTNGKILSYYGPLDINLISFLGNYIKGLVDTEKRVVMRIYKVFIELVQNVSYYSAELKYTSCEKRGKGIGWVNINEEQDFFSVTTGNKIFREHSTILIKNCNEINLLSEGELRELKRKTRSRADVRDVGAHIGLIHTGLISCNPLDIEILDLDKEYSYFQITVKIDK